jgi:hypothetical protein
LNVDTGRTTNQRYVRFIVGGPRHRNSGAPRGIFGYAYGLRRQDLGESWWSYELKAITAWLVILLGAPPEDLMKNHRRGICWFRESAGEVISRVHALADLLKVRDDIWMERLRTTQPGTIIYSDDHQIVAVPKRGSRLRNM